MRWDQEKEQREQQQGQMARARTTTEPAAEATWILTVQPKRQQQRPGLEARQRTELQPVHLFPGHLLSMPHLPMSNDIHLLAVTPVLEAGSPPRGHSTPMTGCVRKVVFLG